MGLSFTPLPRYQFFLIAEYIEVTFATSPHTQDLLVLFTPAWHHAAKQAAILKAEGEKEARIMAAEAEAQAILQVQQALADSLKLLNAAAPNDQVVKLKALETMQKVADGKATKIIIPSELQGLAGLAASAKAVFATEGPKAE